MPGAGEASRPALVAALHEAFVGAETRYAPAAIAAGLAAVAMSAAHIVQTLFFLLSSSQFKSFHVNMAAVLVFLTALARTPPERAWTRCLLALGAVLAAVPLVYIHLEHDALLHTRGFGPSDLDRAIAILMLATVFAATIREWGWVIPALALAGLAYGRYGYLMPGDLLFHSGLSWNRLISYTSIPSFNGMLGFLTEESARTIFVYMLFAGVLTVLGGTELIMRLSFAAVGRFRAGPAQVAVVSSGLFGMISGSTVANVAAQGVFTIPTMRRVGFSREFAGAVEATSSTGGQITPPVLGLAAFLIVGITGIPYYEVMVATVLPALIFYLYMMAAIDLEAIRRGITSRGAADSADAAAFERVPLRQSLLSHGHLLLGVALLFYDLSVEMSAGLAALYPVFLMLGTEAVKQLYRHGRELGAGVRATLVIWGRALAEGARGGAMVAVMVAVINVLVEMFVVSGFGQKLSQLMLLIAGGELWLLLLVSAGVCVLLGCGLPTSAAYILVALLGAPALVKLGVPLLAAHLFVFFYANLSAITPPIAVAALVAANISGGSYFKTSLICVWLGLPAFLLPFIFVVRPELIGLAGGPAEQMLVAGLALASTLCFNFVLQGHMVGPLNPVQRLLVAPAVVCLLVPGWTAPALAYALVLVVGAWQHASGKRYATPAVVAPSLDRAERPKRSGAFTGRIASAVVKSRNAD